jgi:uncharacterized membrane protein
MNCPHGLKNPQSCVVPIAIAVLLCTASLFGQTSSFTSFDAPGAGTGIGQGTFPVGINSEGVIAGWYFDNSFVSHGFVRQPNGDFTEFSPPKMSTVFIYGINNSGQVLGNGNLTISPFSKVGFIREPDGAYTIISVAGSSDFAATAINNKGEVAGYYFGADNFWHSFFRDVSGKITVFDDPNATKATGNGTYAWVINDKGEIGGFYNYNNITGINRAFLRDRLGNFRNFDAVPGGSTLMQPMAINLSGEVTGYYGNAETLVTHCFLRNTEGTVTDFEIPGSSASIASGINDGGTIIGYWMVTNQLAVDSFVRDIAGNITTFAAPSNNYGTFATSINAKGQIIGNWQDNVSFVYHGFVQ